MTPSDLRKLAQLAELKKQVELAKMQPELWAREQISAQVSNLRRRLSEPPGHLEDPVLMLQHTEHRVFLENCLKEKLQALSRVEARIARASPALAHATARKDVAETLLRKAENERRKDKEAMRNALSNQVTS